MDGLCKPYYKLLKNTIMQVIEEIKMNTVNRGVKRFIISQNKKGYFAHELGGKTQWALVFNKSELKAHQLNPTRRTGNQYGRFYRPKPFTTIQDARKQIISTAFQSIQYF